ncbi:anoctamin-7 [Parasteatoda tepidariorum]|nr:anoctamin-7 [Parasteatoda tepidariorum]
MTEYSNYVLVYEDPDYSRDEKEKVDSTDAKKDNLRRRFLVGLRKEGLLADEERVGKHIFVRISSSLDRLYKEAEVMRLELPLLGLVLNNPDEEQEAAIEIKLRKMYGGKKTESQVSAPFQRDCLELFRNNKTDSVLWSSIRCLLVHSILTSINISRYKENGELPDKIGLQFLLMVGAFKDAFALHDPSILEPISLQEIRGRIQDLDEGTAELDLRYELSKKWGRLCGRQPIHEIRDYFGEKIAFYFAWVSTFMTSLWIPAILGLAVFIYGVFKKIASTEKLKVSHIIDIIKSSSDNDLTPYFAAVICLWGTIFTEVWKRKQISLARQWFVDNFDHVEPDRPQFYGTTTQVNPFTMQLLQIYPFYRRLFKYLFSISILLVMVVLVFISVTSVILYRVYMTITICEDNAACDLLHGTIIATLLNTISIMILGKIYEYIAVKLTEWENHQTLSSHNDALIIKLFAFQFANTYTSLFYTAFFRRDLGSGTGIMGLDKKYTDNCGHIENDNCMSLLSFQLLVLMVVKPLPKFINDVVLPWIKKLLRRCRFNEIDDFRTDEGVSKQHYLLREMLKPSAEDFRLGEFTEKMIQYGYLVLFAASFPLAPALALMFNVIDFRIDSRRLLWWNKRPTPYRDNDIGIWFNLIDFINVCGVISNSFLIAFNSELGRDRDLWIKFAIIIGFEHFIFIIKFLISLIIPDVPTWVKNSQRKERYLLSYLMSKLSLLTEGIRPDPIDECSTMDGIEDFHIEEDVLQKLNSNVPNSRWSY